MKRRIRKELLDELSPDYKSPEDLTGPEGLLKPAHRARWSSARWARVDRAPGLRARGRRQRAAGNTPQRNDPEDAHHGSGDVAIETPRDRQTARSSRSWGRSITALHRVSTTRSCRCTPAA